MRRPRQSICSWRCVTQGREKRREIFDITSFAPPPPHPCSLRFSIAGGTANCTFAQVGRLDELVQHVDKTNCDRICAYLAQLAQYVPEPEDSMVLTVAVKSLRKLDRHPEALMMAVRLQDDDLLEEILSSCDDPCAMLSPARP
jgi:hypothetical protein